MDNKEIKTFIVTVEEELNARNASVDDSLRRFPSDLNAAIEGNKYTLDLVNMWISNADNKISVAFAMLSAVLAAVVFVTEDLLGGIKDAPVNSPLLICCFRISVICTGLVFLLSLVFYLLAIIPRLTSGKQEKTSFRLFMRKRHKANDIQQSKSVVHPYSIYYNEINDFTSEEDFIQSVNSASQADFNKEIVKEIFYNSKICAVKMKKYKWGVICSFLSILLAIVSALLYYFAKL